jgi:hypothetical protein
MLEAVALAFAMAAVAAATAFLLWPRKGDAPRNALDLALLAAMMGIVLPAFLALLLGWAGIYSPLLLLACCLAVAGSAAWLVRRRQAVQRIPDFARPARPSLIVLLVGLAAAVLFAHPFEELSMHQDGNVYVAAGAHLARTGHLVERHDLLADLPDSSRDAFYNDSPGEGPTMEVAPGVFLPALDSLFHGFLVLDAANGTVVAQYLHLSPAVHTLGFGLAGEAGAFAMVTLVSVLFVLAWTQVANHLLGRVGALVAGTVLLVAPITVWFGRYPNPELLSGGLLATLLLALAPARAPRVADWCVGGVLLGISFFARIDNVAVALPLLAWGVWGLVARAERIAVAFLLPTVGLGAVAAFYAAGPASYYITSITAIAAPALPSASTMGVAAGFAGLAIFAVLTVWPRLDRRPPRPAPRWVGPAAAQVPIALLAGFVVFAMVTRGDAPFSGDWNNVEMLSWYFGWPLLAVAFLGFAVLATRGPLGALAAWALLAGTLPFLHELSNQNLHPWGLRRYAGFGVPLIAMSAAAFLRLPLRPSWWPAVRDMPAAALALVLLLPGVGYSGLLADHVEFEGLSNQVDAIAKGFEADDVVLLHNQFMLPSIGPALRYLHGVDAMLVWKEPANASSVEAYARAVDGWELDGRTTYVVNPSPEFRESLACWSTHDVSSVSDRPITVPKLRFEQRAIAHEITDVTSRADIWKVVARDESRFDNVTAEFPIRGRLCGFHALETSPEGPFRWTREESSLVFRGRFAEGDYAIQLDLGARRPAPLSPPVVHIDGPGYNDTFTPSSIRSAQEIVVRLEQPEDEIVIRLRTSTWVPKDHIESGDGRALGVAFYAARLSEPAQATAISVEGPSSSLSRFYAREESAQGPFRWTQTSSRLTFYSDFEPGFYILRMDLGGRRPQIAPPLTLEVATSIGDRWAFSALAARESIAKVIEIPSAQTRVEVWLNSTTWVPKEVIGGGDDRPLGVAFYGASILRPPQTTSINAANPPIATMEGFHAVETSTVGSFRWSRGEGNLTFWGPWSPGLYNITLDIGSRRPVGVPPLVAQWTTAGQDYFTNATTNRERFTWRVQLDSSQDSLCLQFHSSTWVPSSYINSTDSRSLGFAFYGATIAAS